MSTTDKSRMSKKPTPSIGPLTAQDIASFVDKVDLALELLRLGPIDPIAVASSLDVLGSTPSAAQDFTRAKARMALVAVTPHEHHLAQ